MTEAAAMAEEGPLEELREEASCSVCLDFFRDPVMIPGCGHTFCRACLTQSWGGLEGAEASCPQCRGKAQAGTLRPNQQLANLVEIIQRLSPSEGSSQERGGQKRKRGVCELHQEPLEFLCREDEAPLCVVCSRSREHRDHQVTPLEEAAGGKKTSIAAKKERVCQKHLKPLKLFCMDDEAPLCVVCDQSLEHQYHRIVPAEEASQKYKNQFCDCLEILRKKRKETLGYKAKIMEESQDLLKQTKDVQQKIVAKFRQLHKFLEEEEERLLAQMEEVKGEMNRHLARLSEELSSLESLIREMEEKCQQPAGELLWDTRSTLQRYEEKAESEPPAAFAQKWPIWNILDLNSLLEGIKQQFKEAAGRIAPKSSQDVPPCGGQVIGPSNHQKSTPEPDTLDSGLYQQKANVTLDLDTAHPSLILSEDRKSVRDGGKAQALPNNPERFESSPVVLGREGFTGGHHFWEVLVGSEGGWWVGVARNSVRRKEQVIFSPEGGIWAVGKWGGRDYWAFSKGSYISLSLSEKPKRIRVCLHYDGGQVAFFDADRGALIYEYSGASFCGETLLPYFWVYKKGHLTLSS